MNIKNTFMKLTEAIGKGLILIFCGVILLVGLTFYCTVSIDKNTNNKSHIDQNYINEFNDLLALISKNPANVNIDRKFKIINSNRSSLVSGSWCASKPKRDSTINAYAATANNVLVDLFESGFVNNSYWFNPLLLIKKLDAKEKESSSKLKSQCIVLGIIFNDFAINDVNISMASLTPNQEQKLKERYQKVLNKYKGLTWKSRVSSVKQQQFYSRVVKVEDYFAAISNPWEAVNGCILMKDKQGNKVLLHDKSLPAEMKRFNYYPACEHTLRVDKKSKKAKKLDFAINDSDARYSIPHSFGSLLRKIDYLNPEKDIFKLEVRKNTVEVDGYQLPLGLSVDTTINVDYQKLAQKLAECYAGNTDLCAELKVKEKNTNFFEKAKVRKLGAVIIDIPTGDIEVLAGSMTDCYKALVLSDRSIVPDYASTCPDWGFKYKSPQPDKALNPAIYEYEQPGSTIKPLMVLAMLKDGINNTTKASLEADIYKSRSYKFHKYLTCLDNNTNYRNYECKRPLYALEFAKLMGFNKACSDTSTNRYCGKQDIFYGLPNPDSQAALDLQNQLGDNYSPIAAYNNFSRWWIDNDDKEFSSTRLHLGSLSERDYRALDCVMSGSDVQSSGRCNSFSGKTWKYVPFRNNSFGQGGKVQISPIGEAAYMRKLIGYSQYNKSVIDASEVHLINSMYNADFESYDKKRKELVKNAPKNKTVIDKSHLDFLITALEKTPKYISDHNTGTAYSACVKIYKQSECANIDVLGKTGTPGTSDYYLRTKKEFCKITDDGKYKNPIKCRSRGMKWYVGAFKSKGSAKYDKAFAVLSERNWKTGGNPVYENKSAQYIFDLYRLIQEN